MEPATPSHTSTTESSASLTNLWLATTRLPPGASRVPLTWVEDPTRLFDNDSIHESLLPNSPLLGFRSPTNYNFFFLGSDGLVHEIYGNRYNWQPGSGVTDACRAYPPSQGSALTGFSSANSGDQFIYYMSESILVELRWDGQTWQCKSADSSGYATPSINSPLLALDKSDSSDSTARSIYYVDSQGHLWEYSVTSGTAINLNDLTQAANAVPVASDSPICGYTLYYAGTSIQRRYIFYIGRDRAIYCMSSLQVGTREEWAVQQIASSGHYLAALSCCSTTASNAINVCYINAADHHVHILQASSSQSSWTDTDLTVATNSTDSASIASLAIFPDEDQSGQQTGAVWVYYVTPEIHLHAIKFSASNGAVLYDLGPVSHFVAFSPRLMQSFRDAKQLTAGAAVLAVGDTFLDIGNDQTITWYSHDATNGAFRASPTGLSGSMVAAGRDTNDNLVVFAAGNGEGITYAVQSGTGNQATWSTPGTLTLAGGSGTVLEIFASNMGGKLYLAAMIQAGDLIAPQWAIWSASSPPAQLSATAISPSSGTLPSVWAEAGGVPGLLRFSVLVGWTPMSGESAFQGGFTAAVAAASASGSSPTFFVIFSDGNIYQFSLYPSPQPDYVGAATPITTNPSWGSWAFSQIVAAQDQSGASHVFAVGASATKHNILYHIAPNTPPVPLRENVAQVSVSLGEDGRLHLFVIDTDQTLTHMRSGMSTLWETGHVWVKEGGCIEQYASYACDVALFDQKGAPLAGQHIEIWTSDDTEIIINGRYCPVGPTTSVSATTNAVGVVSVAQATSSLAVPTLLVWVQGMMPDDAVGVNPNQDVIARLKALTGPELINAKDANQQNILAPKYQGSAGDIASTVQQCVTMATNGLEASTSTTYLHRTGGRKLGRYFKGDKATLQNIHRPSVPEAHWSLTFHENGATYTELSAETAAATIRDMKVGASEDLHEWLSDIGDFFEGVVEGIIGLVKVVVSAAEAVIHLVIDGIKYIFNAIVDTVEKALNLAEAVFAKVAIVFEPLFGWLGRIFHWGDIVRTQRAIEHVFTTSLDVAEGAVKGFQGKVDGGIASLESLIDTAFGKLKAGLSETDTIGHLIRGGESDGAKDSGKIFEPGLANNVVYNAFIDNYSSARSNGSATRVAADGPISAVEQVLEQFLVQVKDEQAFTDALTDLKNSVASESAHAMLNLALRALLDVLQGIVDVALDLVKDVVDAIFQAVANLVDGFKTILEESWEIPFVTDLYKWATGEQEMTLIGIMSLLAAVPVTIIYRIIHDVAPFPDDKSLTDFQNRLTPALILGKIGLGTAPSPGASPAAAGTWTGCLSPQQSDLIAILGACSSTYYRFMTAILDSTLDTLPQAIIWGAVLSEFGAQFCACPWFFSDGSLTTLDADAWGRWLWLYDDVGCLLDLVYATAGDLITNDVQAVVGSVEGSIRLLLAGMASVDTGDALVWSNNIVDCIPMILKVLRYHEIVVDTDGVSLVVLAAVDALGAFTLPVVGYLVAAESFP